MINHLIGLVLFLIFFFLSGIHFYWGLGGKWASDSAIPSKESGQKVLAPTIIDCFAIGSLMLACALFILVKSQLLPVRLPDWLMVYGSWALSAVFFLRAIGDFKYVGFFKKVRSTAFGESDTKYFSPLCLIISLLTFWLAFLV